MILLSWKNYSILLSRAYVNFDIMRRIMETYFDLNVVQVMNITGNMNSK